MGIITQKGGPRQTILIVVLLILVIIVGVYFYSTKRPAPAPSPAAPGLVKEGMAPAPGLVEEGLAPPPPEARVPEARPEIAPLKITLTPEALSAERISKILQDLKKLELVLHGKLPIEVKAEEIGRPNPFVP